MKNIKLDTRFLQRGMMINAGIIKKKRRINNHHRMAGMGIVVVSWGEGIYKGGRKLATKMTRNYPMNRRQVCRVPIPANILWVLGGYVGSRRPPPLVKGEG